MDLKSPYQYKAANEDSYKSLAAYVSTLPATITLHPAILTIVAPEEVAKDIERFIGFNGLDIHISNAYADGDHFRDIVDNETTDASTLREIIYHLLEEKRSMSETHKGVLDEVTQKLDFAKEDRDMYRRWYSETSDKADRVKEQVKAIAVLISSIFPEAESAAS